MIPLSHESLRKRTYALSHKWSVSFPIVDILALVVNSLTNVLGAIAGGGWGTAEEGINFLNGRCESISPLPSETVSTDVVKVYGLTTSVPIAAETSREIQMVFYLTLI